MGTDIDGRILRGIAIYKFLKVAGLLVLSLAAFEIARAGVLQRLVESVASLPLVAGHSTLRHLLAAVSGLPPQRFELAGMVALGYAMLFGVEGYGLWRQRRWGEALTVIATASFVPFEIWALLDRPTPTRMLLLVVNLLIVVYLLRILMRRRSAQPGDP